MKNLVLVGAKKNRAGVVNAGGGRNANGTGAADFHNKLESEYLTTPQPLTFGCFNLVSRTHDSTTAEGRAHANLRR